MIYFVYQIFLKPAFKIGFFNNKLLVSFVFVWEAQIFYWRLKNLALNVSIKAFWYISLYDKLLQVASDDFKKNINTSDNIQ